MSKSKKLDPVIYGLRDPTSPGRRIRYVGQGKYGADGKVKHHVADSRKNNVTHKHQWIQSLLARGIMPELRIIERTTLELLDERERYWIKRLRKPNRLVNSTDGGEGFVGLCEKSLARIGRASKARMQGNTIRRGSTMTPKQCQAISKGLLSSEAARTAWDQRKGKSSYIRTEESNRKNSESHKGVPRPLHIGVLTTARNRARKGKYDNITNGTENKRWLKGKFLPEGYWYGQTIKNHHLRGKSNPRWSEELRRQGKLRKGKMRLITNGKKNKHWMPGDVVPEGWRFGKTFFCKRNASGKFERGGK